MLVLFLILLFVTGCVSTQRIEPASYSSGMSTTLRRRRHTDHNYYIIKKGDTIWSLAKRFNVKVGALTRENNLNNKSALKIGDTLIIPTLRQSPKNKLLFLWPTEGKIVTYFGERVNNRINKGIDIQTKVGELVRSSAAGRVTFSNYLKGYNSTVIIKHLEDFSTVYANLSNVYVKEGESVRKGDSLGVAGKDLRRGVYVLHFEIRNSYKAENPLVYLGRK